VTDVHDEPLDDDLDAEFEELRPEASTRRKVLITLTGVLVVLAILAGGVGFWAYRQLHPSGSAGAEVVVDVPTGSSNSAIADLLERKGVVGNALVFKTWLRLKGEEGFQAGQYKMRRNEDADVVLKTLRAGPLQKPSVDLTVLPGLTVREIPAQILKAIPAFSADRLTQLIAADQDHSLYEPPGKGLEGFLFPDTYKISEGADEASALRTMLAQFDKVAAEVGLDQAPATVGVDPYEALIVASLVEKEAKVDEDRSKIARVIYNRLAAGTPLGVDATLCYLKDEKPCVLRQSDLSADSPYNTRKVAGLPPTPISNVTRASLEAALHPAEGDWIYYVLDPDLPAGQHLFTSSASEFAAAKARCKAAGLGCD
jgi:UPF0755 protein